MSGKRHTIGFLFGDFYGAYTANLFTHIVKSCRDLDQSIIGYGGGFIKGKTGPVLGEHCNYIYNLPDKCNVDGLIIEGSIGNFIPADDMHRFVSKFRDIPIVNIGTNLEGVHNILIDNIKGMEDLVEHLVKVHRYERLAFMAGTEGNFDATQRFEAYRNVLQRYKLPFDEGLVVNGNFSYEDGMKAFQLLKKRGIEYQAVICANDYMAISVIREMEKRGLSVPAADAVTGFDDTEECWIVSPTLTTVKQPFSDIGRESVKMLISLMNGETAPEKIVLPTEFILRESCGCRMLDRLDRLGRRDRRTAAGTKKAARVPAKKRFTENTALLIEAELPILKNRIDIRTRLQRLIDAYDTSGTPRGRDALHERFLSIFRRLLDLDEEILSIHHFISIFWSRLIADYIDPKEETRARELWNETIVLLDLLVQEVQSEKRARLKMESHIAVEVNENFISTFNLAQLKDVVLNNLARFQFDSYYVCLFTDRAMKKAKALLAYDKHRPGKISTRSFPAIDVLPSKIDTGRPAAYVVMALTYQDESYGYAVYSIQTLICFIYASLSVQISGAIKGARLTSELYDYATQLESKVRERTAELEDANQKLKNLDALKNDFIANITHDFRSPLTAILNVSNLALRYNTALDSETRENYDIIFKASLRLKSSIDKLLELARMDAHGITLKVREVEPVSFLDRLLDFYTSSVLGSGIRVVRKLPDACGRGFYTDPEKLEEIIDNIMSNAIKFVDPKNGLITVTLREEKSAVSISISDNGIGIASHKLEAIFNRFEQAHGGRDSPYTGTGIGLAFSRQLVEYLHGSIRAESAGEGRGATFIIELPKGRAVFDEKDFSDEEVKEVKREDLKTLIESDIKLRLQERKLVTIFEDRIVDNVTDRTKAVILIIDDDVNVREIVLKYLRNQRYKNFIIAPDGKMGLDAVYEYSPHLIICDYNMPNMRGDQFHDEIVENPKFKEIPFIFLSAIADDTIMLERRKRGASAYLKKPIDEKILLLTVEENINKYFDYLKISRLATVDELTGLNNRRAILDALRRELAIRKYRDLCLIFMDIDQFKKINDGFGHLAGDELLTAIGDAIQGSIRGYDQPGRYGGDEFLLILPETNLAQGMIVAEGLRRKTAAVTVTHRGKELRVTMSFGIASLREHSDRIAESLDIDRLEDIFDVRDVIKADWELIERQKAGIAEALLETADAALLQAKKSSCADCGFDSETPDAFTGRRCPQCGGGNITVGRNKVVAL